WQLGLLRPDRLQHATLSAALAAAGGVAADDARAGAGGALALGVLKECWDARTDRFDPLDLAADAVGVACGVLALAAVGR
ncbi:MAG TPA: hypothetical protein VGU27_12650, partial [Candidatus Eisenbacteria bacterium]|nr:hypothetical protein [Candidatus Eisenbacteria bacterium]